METALIFSQTLFYLVISLAIIVLGVLSSLVVYNLVKITKQLKEISKNFENTSSVVAKQIEEIIDRLATLPFLSFFFKKNKNRKK